MQNTTTKFTTLLTTLCLLVCLSGCQQKESPLHKIDEMIDSHVNEMRLYATEGQLDALLCMDAPDAVTYTGKHVICTKGLFKATEGPMGELEKLIEKTVETELRKNPKALEAEDQFGLTPAHRIVFRIFVKGRGEHFGFTPWIGKYELLDHAFAFALDKLRTDKKVLGREIKSEKMFSNYLTVLGITKTPMSAGEFLNKIIGSGELGKASAWVKVRALKLA